MRLISTYQIILTFFFFNDTATTEIYTLSLHDALPISLDEAHVRDGMTLLQSRDRADGPKPWILLDGGIDCCLKWCLGLCQCVGLCIGRRKIFAAFDCLDLRHASALRINKNLRERAALRRVDGQLKLPVFHLELAGDRFTFGCTRDYALFQRHLGSFECL